MAKVALQDVFYPGIFTDDEKKDCTTRSWYPLAYAVAAKHGLFIVKDAIQQKEIAIGNQSGFTVVVVGMSNVGRRLRGYDKELAYYVRTNRVQVLASTKLNYMLRKVNAGGDVQEHIERRKGNGNMTTALKDLANHYDRQIHHKAELKLSESLSHLLLDNYEKPVENLPDNIKADLDKIIADRKVGLKKQKKYIEKRTVMFAPPKHVVVYTSFGWHVGKVQFSMKVAPFDEANVTDYNVQELEAPKLYKTWHEIPDDQKKEIMSRLLMIKTSRGTSQKVDADGLIPPDNTYSHESFGCLSAKHPTDGAYFVVLDI